MLSIKFKDTKNDFGHEYCINIRMEFRRFNTNTVR